MNIVQFNPPRQALLNKWSCRSTIPDCDGHHFYLAMDLLNGKVRVVKTYESFAITCDDELTAHIELAYYYGYHGLDYPYDERMFELQRGDDVLDENVSKVMEFI